MLYDHASFSTQDRCTIMEYIVVLVKSSHIDEGLVSQKKIW